MRYLTLVLCLMVVGCAPQSTMLMAGSSAGSADRQTSLGFQQLLDQRGIDGSIVVYDPQAGVFYSNDFVHAGKGFLPASTFKIPNTIIALELGVVEDADTLFPWDGEVRSIASWNRDMSLGEAFHASCVPCYQHIARSIGSERMRDYLQRLGYTQMDVRSDNLDLFWLVGDSRITPLQQIDFLLRFYRSELPISARSQAIVRQMMVIEERPDTRLSGKTGWVVRDGSNIGWFVGYLERDGAAYFVVSNLQPRDGFDSNDFLVARREVAVDALVALGMLPAG